MSSRVRLTSITVLLFLSGCAVPVTVRKEPPTPRPPAEEAPAPRLPLPEPPVVVKPAPERPEVVTPAPPAEDPFASFPNTFRMKARSQEEQGDLRAALLSWHVVRAFLPEDPEARERVTRLERETRSKASGHVRRGKEQYREGKYAEARREFLAALAYDPYLEEAAEYLKRRLARVDFQTYVTKEGDSPKSVAREIYKDPGKDFLVAYFNGLDAGALFRPGTRLTLPMLDIPVAGGARVPARANAPVPTYGSAPTHAPPPAAAPAPTRPLVGPAIPEESIEQGQASFRAGEYMKAAALAERALAKSPGNRDARELRNAAYYQLGTDSLRRQEYPDALRMFRKVDASYRDQKELVARVESRLREEAESHYAAGLKRFLAEDLEGAVEEWETTLTLSPDHPKAKRDLQRARRLLEQVKAAQ
jgi:tetratricopeptide (TPR) repeat protein